MKRPSMPADEEARVEALESLGLLYSPSEERFDRITKLACKIFDVPVALVSLVASENQWFKSAQGIIAAETPREISFCGHAILGSEALVVPDALADERFAGNPLVTGPPNIRFYAGHPVRYRGRRLGTLCLIDYQPRQFSMNDREDLRSLASWVENEISVKALSEEQVRMIKELGVARRQSMVDPVTKTWNRSGLEELLAREFARARREQQAASIVQVEVDDFGSSVSRLGQEASDALMMEVAQRVRSMIRPQDVIGRYGDGSFQLFLGDCFNNCAAGIGQRILTRVNEAPVRVGAADVRTTISIGAGSVSNAGDCESTTLADLARQALQEAREEGGNRVRVRTLNPP